MGNDKIREAMTINSYELPEGGRFVHLEEAIFIAEKKVKASQTEANELQEENNALSVSIRKVTDERDLALEALMEIARKSDVYDRIAASTLDKLTRPTIEQITGKKYSEI